MEIKILANNIFQDRIEEYVFQFDENTTILNMKEKLDIKNYNIDFPKYFGSLLTVYLFESVLPYIESEGRIYCDVNIDGVKITDLLKTFNITEVLEFDYNIQGIGGPSFIVEIFKNIVKAAGVFSNFKDVYDFARYIETKLSKKGLTNNKYFKKHNAFSIEEFIFSKLSWNYFTLAEKLDITPEKAKILLRVFEYEWDNSRKLYYITEAKKIEVEEKIFQISAKISDKYNRV